MPKKQKGIYVALVFGDMVQSPDGSGYQIDPQGKRDFFLTSSSALDIINERGVEEANRQFAVAINALKADIESGGLSF